MQVIDVAMTEGANYVALPLFKWLQGSMVLRKQEDTFLDPNRSMSISCIPVSLFRSLQF